MRTRGSLDAPSDRPLRPASFLSLLPVALLLITLLPATVRADIVRLVGGGELRGRCEQLEGAVRVTLESGATIVVPADDVLEIVPDRARQTYRERRDQLRPYDADGHHELGIWCRQHDLEDRALRHLRRAVEIEPDHAAARRALGHVRQEDGTWLTREEDYARRGLVHFRGRWMPAEEAEAIRREDRRDRIAHRVRRHVHAVRSSIPEQAADGRRAILAIDDPVAEPVILELTEHHDPTVRRLGCRALDDFRSEAAADRLLEAALADPVPEVREVARTEVARRRTVRLGERVVELYLRARRPTTRRAAARLITRLRHREGIDALVDTLHLRIVDEPSGRSWMVARGRTPSLEGRLIRHPIHPDDRDGIPEGYRLVQDVAYNLAALDALVEISGRDHRFRQERWREWWAETRPETPFLEDD